MASDESGGRVQQMIELLEILPVAVFICGIAFLASPVGTLKGTYHLLKGDYEGNSPSTTGTDYEPDWIDEQWER